ncbi:hypothetical protein ABT150_33400 [Streptomyces mirabilis]|uniref:hypothetical protein n=1 Tax=Streptomyces mirabilis TaxID=68239 RepID=UPI0033184313
MFAPVALRGEGAGETQLKQAEGGGVLGAGQGVVEDVCCGGVIVAPGGLVGEVAQEAGAHVVVPGRVGVVQAGDPVLAGVGVAAQVAAVPSDGLGQGGRQGVQTQPEGGRAAAMLEQLGHRGQVCIEQRGGVLPLLGGVTGELLGGVLQFSGPASAS